MKLALECEAQNLKVFSDSQLVVSQVLGEFSIKDDRMLLYSELVNHLKHSFQTFTIQKIERSQNCRADALANMASRLKSEANSTIKISYQPGSSIEEA